MNRIVDLLKAHGAWLLVLGCVPLFATKTLFNLPVAIMTLTGAVRLARHRERYQHDPAMRLIVAFFLCFWLPMWLSLPDAVNPSRSFGNTLSWLRFPLMAVFVLDTLRLPAHRRHLLYGTGIVVGVWCLDAMIQFFAGADLLGYPYNGYRLAGVFHPQLTLGTVTAALSPLYLEGVRRLAQRTWLAWMGVAPLVATIALAGNRAGWLMFAVVLLAWRGHCFLASGRGRSRKAVLGWAAVLLIGIPVLAQSPAFKSRIEATQGLFSTDLAAIDKATAYRLSIWSTALNVFRAHWLNGVGPRGFRNVYMAYADAGDRLVHELHVEGATHPHLEVLEIAVETGVIGLAGFVVFWLLFLSFLRRALADPRWEASAPWAVAALAAGFPLNAHMSFYASYWSTVFWWLLIVAVAMARPVMQTAAGARR